MNLKIFKDKKTRIILGILWGLGLACIFRAACNGRNCVIFKAPRPADVKNKIYSHDEKCYKYETVSTDCNENPIEN
jgi:hypothetical protein